jgi:hypothetical protein
MGTGANRGEIQGPSSMNLHYNMRTDVEQREVNSYAKQLTTGDLTNKILSRPNAETA